MEKQEHIIVSPMIKARLQSKGKMGDSFNDVIKNLLDEQGD